MRQIEGRNAIIEAMKQEETIDVLYVAKGTEKDGSMIRLLSMARERKVLIKTVDKNKIQELAESQRPQGVVAVANDFVYSDLQDVLSQIDKEGKKGFLMLLDEIEDPHNMGAIIRSAEGAGADAVIIPKRRSASVNATVEKASAGATAHMKIVQVTNLARTIDELKKIGYWVYCLDMDGTPYYETSFDGAAVLVVGNEGKGVSRLIKEKADFSVSIPMKGRIGSLNASVAASVVMMEMSRQRNNNL